jgi:hypothetical protein
MPGGRPVGCPLSIGSEARVGAGDPVRAAGRMPPLQLRRFAHVFGLLVDVTFVVEARRARAYVKPLICLREYIEIMREVIVCGRCSRSPR